MKLKLTLALMALVTVGGCATSRSVVSIDNMPTYNSTNPTEGAAIKLVVTDDREFQKKPPTPDIPSLKDGAITNEAITTRAIGRKRNGYGMALGDILLPEGQTVAMIEKEAIANGFRQAGYRVLNVNDPGYDAATTVNASVKQYWAWVNMGFWTITLHCRSEVELQSVLSGFTPGITVLSETQKSTMAAFESDWQKISSEGLSKFTSDLAQKLPRQTAEK